MSSSRTKMVCLGWFGAALGLVMMSGCSPAKESRVSPANSAAPVTVARAASEAVPVQLREIGHVHAHATVAVKSLVDGELERVLFQEGDAVRAGQTLFTIDPRPFEAGLHQAEANLAKDAALVTNAVIEERRDASLLTQQIVSQDVYDQARAAADALRATADADRAAVENARLQLAYCTITSPMDARASTLLVNAGNVVKNQDTILVVLNQTRPIDVDFSVPERELPRIRELAAAGRLKVEAGAQGETAKPAVGELAVINNTVDPGTGTILLRALFPNEEERLWPGQFVNVSLTLTTLSHAVVVPSQAVQAGQQGQYVFVVTPALTAAARPVVAGERFGDETVIQSGLRAGEQVVTSGQLRLSPGVRVAIQRGQERTLASAP